MARLSSLVRPARWLARAAAHPAPVTHAALRAAVERRLRDGAPLTLVYLNIERFRAVLRRCGPDGADCVLRDLGGRLAAAFGPGAVARLPGDEFLLALAAAGGCADPERAMREVQRLVAAPIAGPDGDVLLSAAIGAAAAPRAGTGFQQLFDHAEAGMLAARAARAGAGSPAPDAGLAAQATADALRVALARDEFVLHYQPQVDLRTGRIVGAEALIRWQHPERGLLAPAHFIDAAERTGMIVPIGGWVLRAACRAAARWRADGHGDLLVAVNLSACQFESGGLGLAVQDALDGAGLPPSCLELELTENILIHDTDNVLLQIRQLKNMGLALSLDDFGTGYSSLSYLKKFAVDKIKIDRSFVTGLGADPNDTAIVRAIVQMARSLGLRTIAEGVEEARTLEYLRLLGCDEVQGYHFAPPLPAPAFAKMLEVAARQPASAGH